MLKTLTPKKVSLPLARLSKTTKTSRNKKKWSDFWFQKDATHRLKNGIERPDLYPYMVLSGNGGIDYLRQFAHSVLSESLDPSIPILFEAKPGYSALCGFRSDNKFTKGSFLKAKNGFLLLPVKLFFSQPGLYAFIKACLLEKKINPLWLPETVKNYPRHDGPIEIDTRVIFLGEPYEINRLERHDSDFQALFPLRVDLQDREWLQNKTFEDFAGYLSFLFSKYQLKPSEELRPEITEYFLFTKESRDYLPLDFSILHDLFRELQLTANASGSVNKKSLTRAITNINDNYSIHKQNYYRAIKNRIYKFDFFRKNIGVVNGLSIVSYGTPRREHAQVNQISARTILGSGSVINIERDANLTGDIHDRGVSILQSYLKGLFKNLDGFSLDAAIAFEQNHSLIDGDSASVAELMAILSALAQVAIPGNIAITGALGQYGDAQPVGSVNHKIEGFFEVTGLFPKRKKSVFTVYIPEPNQRDVILKQPLRTAIEKGDFIIKTYIHVEDLMVELFQIPAGKLLKNGKYSEGSLLAKIESRYERKKQ